MIDYCPTLGVSTGWKSAAKTKAWWSNHSLSSSVALCDCRNTTRSSKRGMQDFAQDRSRAEWDDWGIIEIVN